MTSPFYGSYRPPPFIFGGNMNFTYTNRWGEQYFTFFEGGTLSQVQSTNNWYKSSNFTYALAYYYNLILNEAT